ncbi:hypothetical protein [Streptomyces sp. NPDC004134]|uniref:hypothetical protein n=1 Tax=Streptomyces sp. NPDC004134 TaxID=3364691 RepID=UPI00368BE2B3
MESVELSGFVPDFEAAVGRFAETGERVRMTFRRGREVVAELKSAAECAWVDEQARDIRLTLFAAVLPRPPAPWPGSRPLRWQFGDAARPVDHDRCQGSRSARGFCVS